MAVLTEEERRELLELAASAPLRGDLQTLSRLSSRHFLRAGEVDIELVLAFLDEFNEMINHQPKPFKPIIDRDMRL